MNFSNFCIICKVALGVVSMVISFVVVIVNPMNN
jgi:hypothetical protein